MNVKNFLIGTFAAGVAFFLLGWVFYGILFPNIWPLAEGATPNPMYSVLGGIVSGATLSYVFDKIGNMSIQSGAITAAVMGLLGSVSMRFYMMGNGNCTSMNVLLTDAAVNLVIGAVAGAAICFLVGKFGGSNE